MNVAKCSEKNCLVIICIGEKHYLNGYLRIVESDYNNIL